MIMKKRITQDMQEMNKSLDNYLVNTFFYLIQYKGSISKLISSNEYPEKEENPNELNLLYLIFKTGKLNYSALSLDGLLSNNWFTVNSIN